MENLLGGGKDDDLAHAGRFVDHFRFIRSAYVSWRAFWLRNGRGRYAFKSYTKNVS